jgi:Cdc6-like AAA superfamily ATPase
LLAGTRTIIILISKEVSRIVGALHTKAQELHKDVNVLQMQEKTKHIIRWLSAPDPSTNHNRASSEHHDGTGLWFVHGDLFQAWQRQKKSILWLHGIPGCGKTVLSSAIIEHLKQDETCQLLLYFYFSFNDEKKQSLHDLLRSLLEQIHQSQPDSRQPLEQLWASHNEGSRQPSTSSLQNVLEVMLSRTDRVTIILDALDESKSRHELLAWLKTIVESTIVFCKLIVTAEGKKTSSQL